MVSFSIAVFISLFGMSELPASAEVANISTTDMSMAALMSDAARVNFFVFIIAVILSSIAFLLKLLQRGVSPLFSSSMPMRVSA